MSSKLRDLLQALLPPGTNELLTKYKQLLDTHASSKVVPTDTGITCLAGWQLPGHKVPVEPSVRINLGTSVPVVGFVTICICMNQPS
jgi:hypothetical protein